MLLDIGYIYMYVCIFVIFGVDMCQYKRLLCWPLQTLIFILNLLGDLLYMYFIVLIKI